VHGMMVSIHPCFGRRMSKERKARIEASPNWRDGQFQNQIPTPQFTGDKSMFGAVWEFLSERKKDSFYAPATAKKNYSFTNLFVTPLALTA